MEFAITKAKAIEAITTEGRIYNLCIESYRYVHSSHAVNAVNTRLRNALDGVNLNQPTVPANLRSKMLSNLSDTEVSQLQSSAYGIGEEGQSEVKLALEAIKDLLQNGQPL